MKISREVNGKVLEFELHSWEMTQAYMEKQEEYDRQDCKEVYDAEFEKCSVPMTDEVLRRCAKYYRHKADNSGDWYDHAKSAVSTIIYLVTQENRAAEGKEDKHEL